MESEKVISVQRRLKLSPRTCATCAQAFAGWGRQRFCGRACQRRWDYLQHAEVRRANRREYYRRKRQLGQE